MALIILFHQAQATLERKEDVWPLRRIYARCFELTGRTFLVPGVIIYFFSEMQILDTATTSGIIGIIIFIFFTIFIKELSGARSTTYGVMRRITAKFNEPDLRTSDVSFMEILAMNLWHFRRFSLSIEQIQHHLETHGAFQTRKKPKIKAAAIARPSTQRARSVFFRPSREGELSRASSAKEYVEKDSNVSHSDADSVASETDNKFHKKHLLPSEKEEGFESVYKSNVDKVKVEHNTSRENIKSMLQEDDERTPLNLQSFRDIRSNQDDHQNAAVTEEDRV